MSNIQIFSKDNFAIRIVNEDGLSGLSLRTLQKHLNILKIA